MNKGFKIKVLFVVFLSCFYGCRQKTSKEVHNLYLETVNFTPELKSCFDDYFFNQRKSDTTCVMPDTVICYYKDASVLPQDNLLDYTKKMRVTLLEKDSVGNPAFSVEVFFTEGSKWKRGANSGRNPMYVDSVLNIKQLCERITNSTYIYVLKFNP